MPASQSTRRTVTPVPQDDPSFALGQAHHQRGDLQLAAQNYRATLAKMPGHFAALNMLGVVALQCNDVANGLVLIQQAIALQPNNAGAHLNLGNAFRLLKRPADALASYDRALKLQPNFADAHSNRGVALEELARYDEALTSYQQALALNPRHAQATVNLGNAHTALGRHTEALASHDLALAQLPNSPQVHNNRGIALKNLQRLEEALQSFELALQIAPDYVEALANRANILRDLKRHQEALACYDQVLALHPHSAAALNDRGVGLHTLARYEEALICYAQALVVSPNHQPTFVNLGKALSALGRHTEALDSSLLALSQFPNDPQLHNIRGEALQNLQRPQDALQSFDQSLQIAPDDIRVLFNRANVLYMLGRYQEARDGYHQVLALQPDYPAALGNKLMTQLHICDWAHYAKTVQQVVDAVDHWQPASTPFAFLAASDSAASQLVCAKTHSARHYPKVVPELWRGERYTHDRIRLAYLSADFYNHATAHLMAELFELHDTTRFELVAISFSPIAQSSIHTRLERALGTLVDVRDLSDIVVASLLRQNEIDIAVDLKGFTLNGRSGIFAHRAAPIQVSYLGYPGTSGAPYMDYLLADAHVIPEGHERFYSENVVRLPGSYQVNDRQRAIAAHTPSRAECQLPDTGFVFCSFNNNYKITPPVFDIWMRLLHQVPGSVLWLLQDNPSASANLQHEAAQRGIDPQRLVFAPRMALAEHLARHRLADLFLDTLPVNAHTTASDALWAGLPIVTCTGEAFASRVAASLLHATGLPELVTHTLADFEALALKLASTSALLAGFKSRLAANRLTQPLFDTARFCQHIESAYLTMHERYQQGLAPEAFDVRPVR